MILYKISPKYAILGTHYFFGWINWTYKIINYTAESYNKMVADDAWETKIEVKIGDCFLLDIKYKY